MYGISLTWCFSLPQLIAVALLNSLRFPISSWSICSFASYFSFLFMADSNWLLRLVTSLLNKLNSVSSCSWFWRITVELTAACTSLNSVLSSDTAFDSHFNVKRSFFSSVVGVWIRGMSEEPSRTKSTSFLEKKTLH